VLGYCGNTTEDPVEHIDVAIVGAGQAGLAVSHELTEAGIDHLLLEHGRIGETWRRRWASFCLVTPNWSVRLPGFAYDGDQPDGFMSRDEVVGFLERYAASFGAPVRAGVRVEAVRDDGAGGFVLFTSSGALHAGALVLASGAYQREHRIPGALDLPPHVPRFGLADYRDPGSLPAGEVLVIGSGQSGAQIAEELRKTGRAVTLACGRAPWAPRRWAGHDVVWWLAESGFMDAPASALPTPAARLISNPLVTGHDGGRDLNLRTLHAQGVRLTGRFLGVDGREARFAPDLAESVAWGDARYKELMDLFGRTAAARGVAADPPPEPEPIAPDAPGRLDLSRIGSVLFTGGYRPDYRAWLPWHMAFDDLGFPLHDEGESVVVPGLFFVGVHFLRRRKSALLMGVGEDASVVASRVAARARGGIARDVPLAS
jgi:putative flavoprotein involved in K+ transport